MHRSDYFLFPTVVSSYMIEANAMDIVMQIDNEIKGYNGLIEKGSRSERSAFLDKNLELKEKIQSCVDDYTKSLGLIPNKISYSWCNHYKKEGTILPHRHELSVISGAYYPFSDGYAGRLMFDNPLSVFKINEVSEEFNEYNRQTFDLEVFPGLLVLFPSWLTHYSKDNQADNRYVISFDTTIKNSHI
jgi:uncharacterized protein (TIGR02466 family)